METGAFFIALVGMLGVLIHFINVLNRKPTDEIGLFGYNAKAEAIIQLLIASVIYGLLVIGTIKRSPRYLLPWLVLAFIGIIIYGCTIIGFAIMRISSLNSASYYFPAQLKGIIVATSIMLALYILGIHLYVVVYSLYVKLKDEKQNAPSFGLV